jgi:hypothetical protein
VHRDVTRQRRRLRRARLALRSSQALDQIVANVLQPSAMHAAADPSAVKVIYDQHDSAPSLYFTEFVTQFAW